MKWHNFLLIWFALSINTLLLFDTVLEMIRVYESATEFHNPPRYDTIIHPYFSLPIILIIYIIGFYFLATKTGKTKNEL